MTAREFHKQYRSAGQLTDYITAAAACEMAEAYYAHESAQSEQDFEEWFAEKFPLVDGNVKYFMRTTWIEALSRKDGAKHGESAQLREAGPEK